MSSVVCWCAIAIVIASSCVILGFWIYYTIEIRKLSDPKNRKE
jgi:hypothetical protein